MTNDIALFSEEIDFRYPNEKELLDWIMTTVQLEANELKSLNIIFCSDEFLLRINQEYLNHDYYTDIITFDYNEDQIEGELYISIDRVRENALTIGVSSSNELDRVIIHGILHLCGYGDKSEEEIKTMRSKENYYLKQYPCT